MYIKYSIICSASFSSNFFVKQRLMTEKERLCKDPRKERKKEKDREREANQVGDTSCQVGRVCLCV
jgi:hypothetical protein